jgi:hypothetical protein
MAAHELSHQLGLTDEYADKARSINRVEHTDNSLMGDFLKEGSENASIKPRHVDEIGSDVEQARARAAMRPTEPISAQASRVDEAKAAAETQKMPAQTDTQATAANAAAETQKMPAQTATQATADSSAAAETKTMSARTAAPPVPETAPEMPRYESVELANAKKSPIGELDVVGHDGLPTDRFDEKKDATGLKHEKNRKLRRSGPRIR